MRKKIFTVLIVLLICVSTLFASDPWWVGKTIGTFTLNGLSSVSSADIDNVLYQYKGQEASTALINEIASKLSRVDGIASIETGASVSEATGNLILVFNFTELPKLSSINFIGNSKIKESSIKENIKTLKVGDYINENKTGVFDSVISSIKDIYSQKGFGDIPVDYEIFDSKPGYVDVFFYITEGIQTRITSIEFSGNAGVNDSSLKKLTTSRKKALFSSGFFNESAVVADIQSILTHYQSLGYLDAQISYEIEDAPVQKENYHDIKLKYIITEGPVWTYGGMTVTGNTIFSTEEIESKFTSQVGNPVNFTKLESDLTAVQDLYYNNGYITTPIGIEEYRDPDSLSVSYAITIVEGDQSVIEKIVIEGLEKTKEYVMKREITLKEGDVFSKEDLITSMQNLFNTGLLSNVDYEIGFGETPNGVILRFICEEGSHMNIQFGATFGGNVTGFPISGFLQWADTNLGGRAQEIDIATTLSPDSQSANISFGSNWFRNVRWANNFSIGFTHTKYEDEMQAGTGISATDYDDLNYDYKAYPKDSRYNYDSIFEWAYNGYLNPPKEDLMDYHLYSVDFGYSTGYTWIYNAGRLSVSGGLNIGMNHAIFDKNKFKPYDKMIFRYGEKWQFSNSLSGGVSWDGRDYIANPTKGYVLSASFTYAGGLLGGLSNYTKISGSAAGYVKLFEVGKYKSETPKNVMLCVSTSASTMLPQYYKHSDLKKWGWYDAKLGTSRYEMLYLDGMTMARGHDSVTGLKLVWDNMFEISYPLAENIVQAEAFISATGALDGTTKTAKNLDWYYAIGAGVKLKIPGFPLGLYLVKDAMTIDGTFKLDGGAMFRSNNDSSSGCKLVLAISTSLI